MAKRVVLVDDSTVALEWAKEVLSSRGFEVETYSASLGIQSFIRKSAPDLVLLDVRMPALNGDAVCRMLKENPRTRAVRIALYSSMNEDELSTMSKSVGADGFVVKTEDPEKLVAEVKRLLA